MFTEVVNYLKSYLIIIEKKGLKSYIKTIIIIDNENRIIVY